MRGAITYVVRSKAAPVLGKDRRGYRGGSIVKAIAARDGIIAGHFVERDVRLIKGMSIIGEDRLTARDHAVYQLMLAVAREEGIERDFHRIDTRDVARFLRARQRSKRRGSDLRPSRLRESIERLTGTIVRYRHRNRYGATYAPAPLVKAEIHEDPVSGHAILDYSIAEPVRHAVLTSRSYTWLELDAYARFSSVYAARLYPHLALRAGYDGSLGKRWEIAPAELASLVGFPTATVRKLHLASFERRCLKPALADLAREVRGFRVSCKRRAGSGRSMPCQTIVFEIVPRTKPLHHHKAADVAAHLAPLTAVGRYAANRLPSRLVLGRAQTMTGHSAEELHAGWQVALDRAHANPQADCIAGLAGYMLLQTISWQNADVAFAEWVEAVRRNGSIPATVRLVLPPVDPARIEPQFRMLLDPNMRLALQRFLGRAMFVNGVQAMEALIRTTSSDDTMRAVERADAAVAGRVFASCRHAAANGLDYRQWGAGLALLAGARPREAIEAFDELISGAKGGSTLTSPSPAPRSAPDDREFERSSIDASSMARDPLHEPVDLSGLMDDPEPPATFFEASIDGSFPDEADAIPY